MASKLASLLKNKSYQQLRRDYGEAGLNAPESGDSGQPLFFQICQVEGLRAGWERVRQRSPLPGGDGIDVGVWGELLEERLAMLSGALLSGRYHPGPVRHFSVPKKHGAGERVLGLTCVADRVVQSSALIALTRIFEAEFEDDSFGYRLGRSVRDAVDRIGFYYRQGFTHVVEADIQSYFDTIPHAPMLDDLRALLPEPRLFALFSRWLDMAGMDDRGLVQGAPISPLLANLYLDRLDEAVAEHGAHIVRFADDFVVLTRSREKAETELVRITNLLRDRGLVLNPAKTRIADFDQGFAFLGKRFLKNFVLDATSTPDEDLWDNMLAGALPAGQTPDNAHSSRVFRNVLLEAPEALPSRPAPLASPDVTRRLSPRQRALHLQGKGRRLDCRDNAFTVEEGGEEIWLCGADRIDRIDIGPLARVSDAALRFALATGTTIAFVDGKGMTLGALDSCPGGRTRLHLAQAEHVLDECKRMALARELVAGKIANQRTVCMRWRNNSSKSLKQGHGSPARHQAIIDGVALRLERMRRLVERARSASSNEALLGMEGEAAKITFQVLRLSLKGWEMAKRQRRPAPDAVNSVLNWFAHLLARDIDIALRRRGLHVGFSFLHRSDDGLPSLAFDLMEELRAPLVEAQTLTLLNTGILARYHFFEHPDEPERLWMTPEASGKLIHHFERIMTEERLVHPDIAGNTSWRGIIDAQISRLVDHVEGKRTFAAYRIKA